MSEAQHIYQAIGELQATLVVATDGAKFLQSGSDQYPAFIPLKVEEKYQEKYQGQQVYWRVYPKVAEEGLAFDVVTLAEEPLFGSGQFKLQGDWIEPGQLQIWRNAVAGKVNAHNWQPRLLPINWEKQSAPDQAFWQLKAQLVDGTLKIVEAAGPFAHPPRLENQPKFNQKQQPQPPRLRAANPQPQAKQQTETNTETVDWESIIAVSGKLELTIKINTLPQVEQVNGECHFKIDCEGHAFQVSVKPKLWAKLETASTSYEQWIAAISGKLGAANADGFVLEQPNIQVFERQSKTGALSKQEQAGAVEASAPEQGKAVGSTSPKVAAKTQTAPKDAAAQLVMKLEEKLDPVDPLAKPAASKADAKPKKIDKFNVEVR